MGTYVFQWRQPANEVIVTGTFDGWSKSIKLVKNGNIFEAPVALPATDSTIQYKYVVDGKWALDSLCPTEEDHMGNMNNVLKPETYTKNYVRKNTSTDKASSVNPSEVVITGGGPFSSTAALAGKVPLEPRTRAPPGTTHVGETVGHRSDHVGQHIGHPTDHVGRDVGYTSPGQNIKAAAPAAGAVIVGAASARSVAGHVGQDVGHRSDHVGQDVGHRNDHVGADVGHSKEPPQVTDVTQQVSTVAAFRDDPVGQAGATGASGTERDPRTVADAFSNDPIDASKHQSSVTAFRDDPIGPEGAKATVRPQPGDPRMVASTFKDDPVSPSGSQPAAAAGKTLINQAPTGAQTTTATRTAPTTTTTTTTPAPPATQSTPATQTMPIPTTPSKPVENKPFASANKTTTTDSTPAGGALPGETATTDHSYEKVENGHSNSVPSTAQSTPSKVSKRRSILNKIKQSFIPPKPA